MIENLLMNINKFIYQISFDSAYKIIDFDSLLS
jgi:hypothetical protein